MMNKPAHKQNDPSFAPGQVVNPLPSDITLGDYIHRKNVQMAFDAVATEKKLVSEHQKLTFDEWSTQIDIEDVDFAYHSRVWDLMESAWKAGQENV